MNRDMKQLFRQNEGNRILGKLIKETTSRLSLCSLLAITILCCSTKENVVSDVEPPSNKAVSKLSSSENPHDSPVSAKPDNKKPETSRYKNTWFRYVDKDRDAGTYYFDWKNNSALVLLELLKRKEGVPWHFLVNEGKQPCKNGVIRSCSFEAWQFTIDETREGDRQAIHSNKVLVEDLPALMDMLEDNTECASVASVSSSVISKVPSTISHEAAFMIEGFRKGKYPPVGRSSSWTVDKYEIKRWWQEYKNKFKYGVEAEGKWNRIIVLEACMPCLAWSTIKCEMIKGAARRLLQQFISLPSGDTVPLLLSKLESKKETKIHICPYDTAIEGEFAAYLLQIITKKNWEEYKGKNAYIRRTIAVLEKTLSKKENYSLEITQQKSLRKILRNKKARKALTTYFDEEAYDKKTE